MSEGQTATPAGQQTPAGEGSGQSTGSQNGSPPSFSVPEAYKDRPWVEKVKSYDDLWKTLDNAQALIGKRPAGIPAADAPKEEWDKFYTVLGRPESADKYDLKDIEGLPKGVDFSPFRAKAAGIAHTLGLNQKQAEQLWQYYLTEEMAAVNAAKEASTEAQKALDAEFDKITKEYFGEGFDAASKRAQETVAKLVPEGLRCAYAELADKPKALAAIVALTEAMNAEMEKLRKEYGAEGGLPGGDGAGAGGQSIEDARKELAKLRASQEAKDFTHPENKKTMKRIEELSALVQEHLKKRP